MKILILIIGSLCLISCASNQKKAALETTAPVVESTKPTASTLVGASQTLWKAECRKIVNEAGKEITDNSSARIQSSYIFEKTSVVWHVINHSNAQCKGELTSGDRYTFKCNTDATKKNARCTETKVESFDNIGWKEAEMSDGTDRSSVLVKEYRMTSNQPNTAKLRSRSITDEGEWTLEHLTSDK